MTNQDVHSWADAARLTVVVGHFGSGKSEFSVNLALKLAEYGHPFALADLDVVDPYFRSRECKNLLEAHGGRLITSSQACMDADVPSMPPEVMTLFDNKELYGVLDIGGDASGARVLARYRHRLQECGARVLCVINANRPLTDTPEKAVAYVESIAAASGLHIDGLVNNTHLCDRTEAIDIRNGANFAYEVSALTGIPIACHAVPKKLVRQVSSLHSVFPMELYLKKPWEQELPQEEVS